jgi:hypothetical protein
MSYSKKTESWILYRKEAEKFLNPTSFCKTFNWDSMIIINFFSPLFSKFWFRNNFCCATLTLGGEVNYPGLVLLHSIDTLNENLFLERVPYLKIQILPLWFYERYIHNYLRILHKDFIHLNFEELSRNGSLFQMSVCYS